MMQSVADASGADRSEADAPRLDREILASEVGAAIAHQLNGPLTALLLYLGDLCHEATRLPAADSGGPSLQQIAHNALHEAERVCVLIQRLGDTFEAPLKEQTAFAHGRRVIRLWSRAGHGNDDVAESPAAASSTISLTTRECEVLNLVREGCSNKEGGARLQISHRTFESHRARLMRKFGARNVAALLLLAAQDREGGAGHGSGPSGPGKIAKPKRARRSAPCKR
jgi:DNA-binding CsgD family transcriptional regulator